MRLIAFAVAPLMVLACSEQSARTRAERAPVVEMSEQARVEMLRVNASRLSMEIPAQLVQPEPSEPAAAAGAAQPAEPDYDGGLVRIQTLLDRAHFSPGVIDGHDGENVRKAVAAYQRANGLPEDGRATDALLRQLEEADGAQALVAYVLTEADISGPFVDVPESMQAQSRLRHLGYENATEAVAEKFHMDEDLLRTLNPGVDFTRAGVEIVVANAGGGLSGQVARIEIDKDALTLRAYDASDRMLAFYPVTIGAGNTPSGELEITGVHFDPTYNYDADELPSFNDSSGREFQIKPGPNNPVGLVWMALNRDGYGIHGTPNPSLISKTSSHGCIRLTNWDAVELASVVQAGVPVQFLEGGAQVRRETSRG
ncbi:MAG TPA: L,D-transpeptidase [Vitreimonas sp.]|uniref:L,D-transpeptidase family protein n=1 Tax=Vitreimonas sp. TaxID=3069702 RepID=UPI002D2DE6B3|nr:L,D-transpeptidase [Vitreimonas sp.]HYD86202.1 L,D-transpeptidase [Vitreimonas sp.]